MGIEYGERYNNHASDNQRFFKDKGTVQAQGSRYKVLDKRAKVQPHFPLGQTLIKRLASKQKRNW